MAQLLPLLRTRYGRPIGVELYFTAPDLSSYEHTYLESDHASGVSALVANGVNLAIDNYILIGNLGQEKSEIIKLHASTAPTATAITLASATAFAHNRGDVVTFIPYNQIISERSTDAGVNFTPLTAVNIRADASETFISRPADASTDYYRFRFYNSTAATYSAYSGNAVGSGFADNSIFMIKKKALDQLGEKVTDFITDEFLTESLQEGRRDVDEDPRVNRWRFRTSFNYDAGNVIAGTYSLTVPATLRNPNTFENILAIAIGKNKFPLQYQDKVSFNQNYMNIGHTTLATSITAASTSIVLTSSGDFNESGSISIAGASIGDTVDAVAYTANNESTATLTGATGIAGNHAAGVDIWQDANFGLPTTYTVDNGIIYFNIPFSDAYDGENIWMDFYKIMPSKVTDSDVLDEPEYDLFVSYLKWKIKYKKSNGSLNAESDGDYKEYRMKVDKLVAKELPGQFGQFVPDYEDYTY